MKMESTDWIDNTMNALRFDAQPSPGKWPAFTTDTSPFSHSNLTIPPSLLSHSSIERYGQVTPPDDMSPAECINQRRDSLRETSVPLEQIQNEALWPGHHHSLQALQNFDSREQAGSGELHNQNSPKRRRTRRAVNANQRQDYPHSTYTQAQDEMAEPGPPTKRKRGRPKLEPQMVEAYTSDGFPFQVSSARQSHLEKNRVAAHKCRQRKKEYIGGLEERARVYSANNRALKEHVAVLRDELLVLKNEVLRHAGCGFWAVDEYLARCAGDLASGLPANGPAGSRLVQNQTLVHSPALPIRGAPGQPPEGPLLETSESLPNQDVASTPNGADYGDFQLLKDMDLDD